jgi:hypothetical protein
MQRTSSISVMLLKGNYTDRRFDSVWPCAGGPGVRGLGRGRAFGARLALRFSPADHLAHPSSEKTLIFSTLAYELAHGILHQSGESSRSKTVRETAAVALVVCRAIGLNSNSSTSDYIQLYDGDKKTLIESLERIQQTAGKIIRGVMPHERENPAGVARTVKFHQRTSRGMRMW